MTVGLAIPNTKDTILSTLLELKATELTSETAAFLIAIHFSPADINRINHLSDLAQEGMLSADEYAELESFIYVSNQLAIMQSKARRHLKSKAGRES